MSGQVLLVEESGAVEPLQLSSRGVTFPISAGDGQQFKGPNRSRLGHVRSATEVQKLALPIKRYGLVLLEPFFDVLDFELLLHVAADLQGLVPRLHEPFKRLVFLDDLLHFRFDGRKIVFRKRLIQIEIVVIATLDGRTEGQLDAFAQPHDRSRHHMSTGVPHNPQRLGVLFGEQAKCDFAVRGQLLVEANDGLVYFSSQSGFGQARPNIGSNVARSG